MDEDCWEEFFNGLVSKLVYIVIKVYKVEVYCNNFNLELLEEKNGFVFFWWLLD